jgi:hypothetical protein
MCSIVLILFGKNLPKVRPFVRTSLNKMKNKTQHRIHKHFFSHYFCFVFFRKNFIRGNAATNNTPNEGGKFHRGKVKEVGTFQYVHSNSRLFSKRLNCNKPWIDDSLLNKVKYKKMWKKYGVIINVCHN